LGDYNRISGGFVGAFVFFGFWCNCTGFLLLLVYLVEFVVFSAILKVFGVGIIQDLVDFVLDNRFVWVLGLCSTCVFCVFWCVFCGFLWYFGFCMVL